MLYVDDTRVDPVDRIRGKYSVPHGVRKNLPYLSVDYLMMVLFQPCG